MEIDEDRKNEFINYILNILNTRNRPSSNNNMDDYSVMCNEIGETIGNNTKVLKIIIRSLTNPVDRKNVERVSKKFYSMCNEIGSYIPLSGCEKVTRQYISGEEGGFHFIISKKEIVLCIFKTLLPEDPNYDELRMMLRKYAPHMESLCIMITSSDYYEVFKNLECFGQIKTVRIDIMALQTNGIGLFTICPNLRPTNLYILNMSHYQMNIIDNQMFQFPNSIKNVFFESGSKCLRWLLDKMATFSRGYLEKFYISEHSFSSLLSIDDKMSFLNIIQFFKKVNYYADDFISDIMDKYMAGILNQCKIESTININFSKDKFNSNISKSLKILEMFDSNRGFFLSTPSYRFLCQPGVCMNISSLGINDKNNCRRYHPFSSYELKFLTEDLTKMGRLKNLDIDLHLFRNFLDFKYFCNGIKSELKCLRIGRCSTIMSYYFPEISRHFGKLEYLYLNDVGPYTTVTISEILRQVNYLKGLKIVFNEFYNTKYILNDLERNIDNKESKILKWPEIDYLDITFACSTREYHETILQIEKNTPRKMGKFLVKRRVCNGKMYYHIIIQRSTVLFDKFEELFDPYR